MRSLIPVLALGLAISACAPAQPKAAEEEGDEGGPAAAAFDPALANPELPCTMLTPGDAERFTGKPMRETTALDLLEARGVRCVHTVGARLAAGAVEVEIKSLPEGETPAALLASLCRSTSPAPLDAPGCVTWTGSYAAIVDERVIESGVRTASGAIDQELSLRLAGVMVSRFKAASSQGGEHAQ